MKMKMKMEMKMKMKEHLRPHHPHHVLPNGAKYSSGGTSPASHTKSSVTAVVSVAATQRAVGGVIIVPDSAKAVVVGGDALMDHLRRHGRTGVATVGSTSKAMRSPMNVQVKYEFGVNVAEKSKPERVISTGCGIKPRR